MTDEDKQKEIEKLKETIASAEKTLEEAKKSLFELTGEKSNKTVAPSDTKIYESGKVIEGIFDGENMLGPDGKAFPVPANYASKSKLVEGDKLKLTVAEDGSFIYKQIGPVERKRIIGTLAYENNTYHVLAEGKAYNVLYASVTYFKAKPEDRVTIVIPEKEDATWAALENVIHNIEQMIKIKNGEREVKMPKDNINDENTDKVNSETPEIKRESVSYTGEETEEVSSVNNTAEVGTKDGREALPDGHFLPMDETDDNEQNAMGEKIVEAQKDIDLEI